MYIENNYETNPGYTSILNQNELNAEILEDLKFNISTQFNQENLGYNYLKDYDNPPLEIYDWIITYINENYFLIPDLINIYDQVDGIKFLSITLYEFLFVDILNILNKINLTNTLRLELLIYCKETLQSLNTMKYELGDLSNKNIDNELLKYSTLLSVLDTNLEKLKENHINIIELKYLF